MKNKNTHRIFLFSVALMALILSSIYGVTSLKTSPPDNVFAVHTPGSASSAGTIGTIASSYESGETFLVNVTSLSFGTAGVTPHHFAYVVVSVDNDLDETKFDIDVNNFMGTSGDVADPPASLEENDNLKAGGFLYSIVYLRNPVFGANGSVSFEMTMENTSDSDKDFRITGQVHLDGHTTFSPNPTVFTLKKAAPAPVCGDGNVEGAEQCDDGGTVDGDGCSAACVTEFCGDGVINNSGTEACDGTDFDGATCLSELGKDYGQLGCTACVIVPGSCTDTQASSAKRKDRDDTPSIIKDDEEVVESSTNLESLHDSAEYCQDELVETASIFHDLPEGYQIPPLSLEDLREEGLESVKIIKFDEERVDPLPISEGIQSVGILEAADQFNDEHSLEDNSDGFLVDEINNGTEDQENFQLIPPQSLEDLREEELESVKIIEFDEERIDPLPISEGIQSVGFLGAADQVNGEHSVEDNSDGFLVDDDDKGTEGSNLSVSGFGDEKEVKKTPQALSGVWNTDYLGGFTPQAGYEIEQYEELVNLSGVEDKDSLSREILSFTQRVSIDTDFSDELKLHLSPMWPAYNTATYGNISAYMFPNKKDPLGFAKENGFASQEVSYGQFFAPSDFMDFVSLAYIKDTDDPVDTLYKAGVLSEASLWYDKDVKDGIPLVGAVSIILDTVDTVGEEFFKSDEERYAENLIPILEDGPVVFTPDILDLTLRAFYKEDIDDQVFSPYISKFESSFGEVFDAEHVEGIKSVFDKLQNVDPLVIFEPAATLSIEDCSKDLAKKSAMPSLFKTGAQGFTFICDNLGISFPANAWVMNFTGLPDVEVEKITDFRRNFYLEASLSYKNSLIIGESGEEPLQMIYSTPGNALYLGKVFEYSFDDADAGVSIDAKKAYEDIDGEVFGRLYLHLRQFSGDMTLSIGTLSFDYSL